MHASATTLTASAQAVCAHLTFYFLLISIFGLTSAYTERDILPCKTNLGGIFCPKPLRQSGGGIETGQSRTLSCFGQGSLLLSLLTVVWRTRDHVH